MSGCLRGGLTTLRIVQHIPGHATMLSLVSCRLGVAFVSEATRWQCPSGVLLCPVVDLSFPLTFYLIWKEGSSPPLLQRFLAQDEVADPDP
jgi:DNA-binding transcriptional LysR family regulator